MAGIPAGTWHVIADGVVIEPVDVTFELIQRRGATDLPLATWTQHFDPPGGTNFYVPYELDEPAGAVTFQDGDLLVYRYTGNNSTSSGAWEPNADDDGTGRDTQLTPPPPP